ncbi:MAG: DUF1156 domain-containing protein [Deltaproteobacteria bacterium]|nr:DUF1156 domain-containing protein [Deltaproteobacteria bacterium]
MALLKLINCLGGVIDEAIKSLIAFAISKQCDFNSSLSRWANHMEKSVATFGRHALPILWDWGEIVPISDATGSFLVAINWIIEILEKTRAFLNNHGQVIIADACSSPLPGYSVNVWFTDPPYYDAIPYSDLSDFFFVWLKRALPTNSLMIDPFDNRNLLTPKALEIVQDSTKDFDGNPKDRTFFENRIELAFRDGRRVLKDDGIGSVIFAHKTTEGWEAFLSGISNGGWVITASWPISTEKPHRMRAFESAALGSSIHLVCRPRPPEAGVGDWAEVKAEMEARVRAWIKRLQEEGIRGADALFACIGPAMEVYSRYDRVETPAGHRRVPGGPAPGAGRGRHRGL